MNPREIILKAERLRSLVWQEDSLVDLVDGGTRYDLDGGRANARINWAYPFDAAITCPGTGYAVIYARLGTKALLLEGNRVLRELNRSFYHANVYEYPVCLVRHEQRVLLIHCPDHYNRLEIDDAETGERLTSRDSKSSDIFHSRLSANPAGTRFLSAGWVWHPWDVVVYFDIAEALRNPQTLDSLDWCSPTSRNVGLAEETSACWQEDALAIVTASDEAEDPEEVAELGTEMRLRPRGVIVYDTTRNAVVSSAVLEQLAGTVMPIGDTHILAFYDHPRLVRLSDGKEEFAWPSLSSGRQTSSIMYSHVGKIPPMAFDPKNRRFAVAQDDGIHVISV